MTEFRLGVSWSATKLKLLCLKRGGKGYQVVSLDHLAIPDNNPDEAGKLLREWIGQHLPRDASVTAVVTLPESSIFLKQLELPKAKHGDLATTIFWEISTIAPIPPDEAVLAWKIISQDRQTTDLAAMVVRDSLAEQILTTFNLSGIKLSAIEPSSLAFGRIVNRSLEKTSLLVAVEGDETNFVILKRGAPIFSTSSSVLIKKMEATGRTLDSTSTKSLALSTKQAMAFWEEKGGGKVDEVIITGDVLKYFGLASAIYRLTLVPAFLARAKTSFSLSRGAFSHTDLKQFFIPLGAAARLILPEKDDDVNLFPKKEQQILLQKKAQKAMATKISLFSKLTGSFLAVCLVMLVGFTAWSSQLRKELDQTQRFVENHPAQKLIPEIIASNTLLSEVEQLTTNQKDTGERLRQIASLTPSSIRFTELKFSEKEDEAWEIGGIADRDVILAFYSKIAAEAGAKEVSMPYSNLAKEKENDFTITILWQ